MLGYKYLGLFGLKIPHPAAWQMHWDDGEQEMETYSMFQDINIQFSKILIMYINGVFIVSYWILCNHSFSTRPDNPIGDWDWC